MSNFVYINKLLYLFLALFAVVVIFILFFKEKSQDPYINPPVEKVSPEKTFSPATPGHDECPNGLCKG